MKIPLARWLSRPASFLIFSGLIFLGLLSAGFILLGSERPGPVDRPNILYIVIETLRADHLGCYGYLRDTSPHIDRIAEKGILFENFYSVSSWTNPTVATLFTGLYPGAVFPPAEHAQAIKQVFPEMRTLAKILKEAGYHTIAFNEHPGLNRQLNYDQGFQDFHELWLTSEWQKFGGIGKENMVEKFKAALEQSQDRPWFIYSHLLYPHALYDAPQPYREMFGPHYHAIRWEESLRVINAYDGEVRYTDEIIGAIFRQLEQAGLLGETVVIITADHGEGFWDHGYQGHGNTLHEELLHIPLVIYPPGGRQHQPARITHKASNLDLFPTVLDLAGIPPPGTSAGKSLLRFWQRGSSQEDGLIFSESCRIHCVDSVALISGNYKMIYHASDAVEFYDLAADPFETKGLAASRDQQIVSEMSAHIKHHLASNARQRKQRIIRKQELDQGVLEHLKSLGYLQ